VIIIGVTGSRYWRDPAPVAEGLDYFANGHDDVLIRHGKCPPHMLKSGAYVSWDEALRLEAAYDTEFLGADWLAAKHARERGWRVQEYPADWAKYGNRAGPVRNERMVWDGAHVWLGFLHEESRGSVGCLEMAKRARIPTFSTKEDTQVDDGE
jgi:hypothetical protein